MASLTVPRGRRWAMAAAALLAAGCPAAAAASRSLCGGAEVPLDAGSYDRPFVHMRLGRMSGAFLIDTGSTFSSVDAAVYGIPAGSRVSAAGSSMPTIDRGDDLHATDLGSQPGPSRVVGVIGTDFLSTRTTEFHYDTDHPYLVISDRRCGDLAAHGLTRFEQAGRFGPPGPKAGRTNIPTVTLTIGSLRFPAWIDTGFFEAVPGRERGVLKANAALVAALRASGTILTPSGEVNSVTCDGISHRDQVMKSESPLRDVDGLAPVSEPLIQEVSSDACGGPGTVDTPLGMVGARWLLRWGTVVLAPLDHAVWLGESRN